MAEIKITIEKDERREQEKLIKAIEELAKKDREKLKGFLEGIAFLARKK